MKSQWMSAFISSRSRRAWIVHFGLLVLLVLVALAYEPLNHHVGGTHDLATSLDRQIPVIPIFAVPYIAFLPIFWLLVLYAFATNRLYVQLALTALIVYMCSDVVFVFYHTVAPRPRIGGGFLNELVRFIYAHDEPYNDLPSEHTSSAIMLGLYFYVTGSRWRALWALYALSVVASTLFVKQHTIVGAAGGVALAAAAWTLISHFHPMLAGAETSIKHNRLDNNREQYPSRDLGDSSTP